MPKVRRLVTSIPDTRYAKSGDIHVAYQVMGSGPLDLVLVPGFISHLEMQLEEPHTARFFERLYLLATSDPTLTQHLMFTGG
jgi:hypothetical protein